MGSFIISSSLQSSTGITNPLEKFTWICLFIQLILLLLKTKVTLINFTDSLIEFKVDYTTTNKVGNQNDSTCYIEVEI
jgi:preprotein translocase subunit SecG